MPTAPDAAEKARMAFTLHLAGLSWQEVADHQHEGEPLYAHYQSAYRAAKTYQESTAFGDNLMDHRATDMARFDALQRAMWRKAIGGDLAAAKFVLQVMRAREELLGVKGVQPADKQDDPIDELAARRGAS